MKNHVLHHPHHCFLFVLMSRLLSNINLKLIFVLPKVWARWANGNLDFYIRKYNIFYISHIWTFKFRMLLKLLIKSCPSVKLRDPTVTTSWFFSLTFRTGKWRKNIVFFPPCKQLKIKQNLSQITKGCPSKKTKKMKRSEIFLQQPFFKIFPPHKKKHSCLKKLDLDSHFGAHHHAFTVLFRRHRQGDMVVVTMEVSAEDAF